MRRELKHRATDVRGHHPVKAVGVHLLGRAKRSVTGKDGLAAS